MSPPIQLSLAGDGRLVILTPETVRKAFFQFTKVNPEYTAREKYKLNYPSANGTYLRRQAKKSKIVKSHYYRWSNYYDSYSYEWGQTTVLDALHRKSFLEPENFYLEPQDILRVERQINRYILNYDLALVENEGKILEGSINCKQVAKNRRKVKYIIRYGMYFILEPISRPTMIKMRDVDLFFQDRETYDFHLIRYKGVLLSSLYSRIRLSFCDRLDLSRNWTCTTDEFNPQKVFQVKEIYPCDGFCLV